jgi:hypothetical protein
MQQDHRVQKTEEPRRAIDVGKNFIDPYNAQAYF